MNNTEFEYVNELEKLEEVSKLLRVSKEIAIDLECENNLHHYGTKISLIQVSNNLGNWVVDVIAIKNPNPLIEILVNPEIVKVFHDVSFDFKIIKETYGILPVNVFDTALASQLLGYKQVGLGSLLELHFGFKKEKKFQKADWTKRPLSNEMLLYAASDTSFLLKLRFELIKELEKKNRLSWAEEEFKSLEKEVSVQNHPIDEENSFFFVKGAGSLSDVELSVFRAIYNEREIVASIIDKPVYFVIKNKTLLELAVNPPKSVQEWKKLKEVHPYVRKNAEIFFNAVKESLRNPISKRPRREKPKKMNAEQKVRFEKMDELRRKIALELDIEPFLVLDRDEMIQISTGRKPDFLKRWQQSLLSEKIDF